MKHNMTFSDLMSKRQAAGTLQHQHRDPRDAQPGVAVQADHVFEAARQAHVRSPVFRVHLNTNREENQPAHSTLWNRLKPVGINLRTYAGLEARFCLAGVYEFVKDDEYEDRLKMDAKNSDFKARHRTLYGSRQRVAVDLIIQICKSGV
jgi:electron-transferring-flavoprotein dehydrogenase